MVVGAGISGLVASSYALGNNKEVLLLEKNSQCGGLVSSFWKDQFLFDTGPRALGNAGILKAMIKDLNLKLPLAKGSVSTGIREEIVHYDSEKGVSDFIASLEKLFPDSRVEIGNIEKRIRSSCRRIKILNRVENPFFKHVFKDRRYLFKELIPWLPSFFGVLIVMAIGHQSVEDVLDSLTENRALKDMLSQHFFKGTPANFALGYFENFQDYLYPKGGTGELPRLLEEKILKEGGTIKKNREIVRIFSKKKKILDLNGESYDYDKLIWAADLKSLYSRLDTERLPPSKKRKISHEALLVSESKPGESVFSLFIGVNESPVYFEKISRGHFIYTPSLSGLGEIHKSGLKSIKRDFETIPEEQFFQWLKDFVSLNSFEISIPVLKDPALAPEGQTGIIVSLLFDGELTARIDEAGWMKKFRTILTEYMLNTLDESIYPGLKGKIRFVESATPQTLRRMFNTSGGAITGWSMEEKVPVPTSLTGIYSSAKTSIPHIYKTGQWSYSPSGVPIAILTGRIAASIIR